jgi:TatD DNase family protein
MIRSGNGKKIISEIPKELVLTETDFPFIKNDSLSSVYYYLSQLWEESVTDTEQIIYSNFVRVSQNVK